MDEKICNIPRQSAASASTQRELSEETGAAGGLGTSAAAMPAPAAKTAVEQSPAHPSSLSARSRSKPATAEAAVEQGRVLSGR